MITFGCTVAVTLEEAQETTDEAPVGNVMQSVPDEDSGDEIIHSIDVLAEVKLPSTICKSAQILL